MITKKVKAFTLTEGDEVLLGIGKHARPHEIVSIATKQGRNPNDWYLKIEYTSGASSLCHNRSLFTKIIAHE